MTAYNRTTLIAGLAIAVAIGGAVSYFASRSPDGLEKTQENLGVAEQPHGGVTAAPVVFNEYSLKWLGQGFWSNAIAGVIGVLLVFAILLALGRWLKRGKAAPVAEPRGQRS